eukprot:gene1643-3182_t
MSNFGLDGISQSVSKFWVVSSRNVVLQTTLDSSSNNSNINIPQGAFLLCSSLPSPTSKTGFIQVIFPYKGWISLTPEASSNQVQIRPFKSEKHKNSQEYIGNGIFRRYADSTKWTNQWPIGSGRTGALVGGEFGKELIPLSVADLFVKKRVKPDSDLYKLPRTIFKNARADQIRGNLDNVHKKMGQASLNVGDAHLEYAADLTFCYSATSFPNSALKNKDYETEVKDRDVRNQPFDGLDAVFPPCVLKKQVNTHHVSFLDTKVGVATSLFISDDNVLHRRRWFASASRDVLIGTMDCHALDGTSNTCLNMVMRLSRQSGWHSPAVTVSRHDTVAIESQQSKHSQSQQSKQSQSQSQYSVQGINLAFAPSRVSVNPHVHVCVAVVCHGSRGESWERGLKDTVVCQGGTGRAEVLVAIEKEDTGRVTPQAMANATMQRELLTRCWVKLDRVLKTGIFVLQERHARSFATKMSRTSLHLSSVSSDTTEAFMEGSFHLGRYLLLSSATRAVTNLQAAMSMRVGDLIQGSPNLFPSFPQWLGKNSSTGKARRLTNEIVVHTMLAIGQGFLGVRTDYIPFLRHILLQPLLSRGSDGVDEVVALLESYGLSKEDFSETLKDLQFIIEKDKILIDKFDLIDSKVKAALTREYNSMEHRSQALVDSQGSKKKRGAGGGTGGGEDDMGEEGTIEDLEAAKKHKKAQAKPKTTTTAAKNTKKKTK